MPVLPAPGLMMHLSPEFTPAHLVGLTIHPDNALQFDFLVHRGDQALSEGAKKQEYNKLVKYFLASLTIPDDDQWVNLSPYEKNRIIKDDFGKTEMGRDLLGQDYLLKQITSSLIYPEERLGQKFWDRVYERAYKEYGTTNIPVNTFNKVWILPDQAAVYESGNTVYVLRNHLKVMLEEDYLSLSKHAGIIEAAPQQDADVNKIGSQIVREIVLPALEQEVNEGKNFANLRQIYGGMILATWYKHVLKESLLGKVYANQSRVKGVDQNPKNNAIIYKQYLKAFKKGVFNYIKEDVDKYTNEVIPRKYFSGGMHGLHGAIEGDIAMAALPSDKLVIFRDRTLTPEEYNNLFPSAELDPSNKIDDDDVRLNVPGEKGNTVKVVETASGLRTIQGAEEPLSPISGNQSEQIDEAMTEKTRNKVYQELADLGLNEEQEAFKDLVGVSQMQKQLGELLKKDYPLEKKARLRQLSMIIGIQDALEKQFPPNRRVDGLPPEARQARDMAMTLTEAERQANGKLRILLVDDDSSERFITGIELSYDGFTNVEEAEDGLDALRKIKEKPEGYYHVILTDNNMSGKGDDMQGMDGIDLANALSKTHPHLPVIIRSGKIEELRSRNEALGNLPNVGERLFDKNERAKTYKKIVDVFTGLSKKAQRNEQEKAEAALAHATVGSEAMMHTVLVIDNDPDDREFRTHGLKRAGFAVETADSGAEALKRIEQNPLKYLGVLTDNDMGAGINGIQLTAILKVKYPHLPVVINSSEIASIEKHFKAHWVVSGNLKGILNKNDPLLNGKINAIFTRLRTIAEQGGQEKAGAGAAAAQSNVFPNFGNKEPLYTGDEQSDFAMGRAQIPHEKRVTDHLGGIDLNSANLDLQIKRDGRGVPLPLAQQDMAQLSHIQGFEPEILSIRPAVNLPILNELQQKLQASSV